MTTFYQKIKLFNVECHIKFNAYQENVKPNSADYVGLSGWIVEEILLAERCDSSIDEQTKEAIEKFLDENHDLIIEKFFNGKASRETFRFQPIRIGETLGYRFAGIEEIDHEDICWVH